MNGAMLGGHLRTAARSPVRHKANTLVSAGGLAVGLAASLAKTTNVRRQVAGGFAYRTEASTLDFVASTGATLLIAVLATMYQTLRAATADPGHALRCQKV